jgi:hypothetical protein
VEEGGAAPEDVAGVAPDGKRGTVAAESVAAAAGATASDAPDARSEADTPPGAAGRSPPDLCVGRRRQILLGA